MQQTLLFYDLETSGLDKSYDQVQQFAGIRTDMALNELERHEIFVKINPDIIPNPHALMLHRVSINTCQNIGLNEYEAMQRIHALMNTPNTISVGYNTLGFDDEFLRFSFHRNLLTPYTHQFANGCGRADLYPMAAMLRWQQAECLTWPNIEGSPTLKLEHLNATNQLAQGQAHNALVDVEATISLAKRFQSSGASWDYLLGYFNKHVGQKRLQQLRPFEPLRNCHLALMIDGNFGGKNHYQCPVLGLGTHHHYHNQTLWLKLDQQDLSDLNEDNLGTLPWIIRKKAGESPFFLPDKPRYMDKLLPDQKEILESNLAWLKENVGLLEKLQTHHCQWQYPELPDLPPQANLYQSNFLSSKDLQQCAAFHLAEPEQKARLAKQIQRPDLQQLADDILAKHYAHDASETQRQCLAQRTQMFCDDRPMLNHVGKLRITFSEIQEAILLCAQQNLDNQQQNLLAELKAYIGTFAGIAR